MIAFIPVDRRNKESFRSEGLDIEKDYNKKIGLSGVHIKCFSAFMSPDLIAGDFVTVRISGNYEYIANYDLWMAFELTQNDYFNKMYISSITNLKRYRYGEFRIPEVLILKSIDKDDILDISDFVLFEDKICAQNDQIYLNCLIEKISQDPNIAKHLVIDYFDKLCKQSCEMTKKVVPKGSNKLYIFIQKNEWAWTVEI